MNTNAVRFLAVSVLAAAVAAPAREAPAAPPLAADCASLVLRCAGGSRWIVADGPLAPALREAARAAGRDVVVLPPLGGDEETLDRAEAAAAAIPSEAVRRALAFGAAPFLRAWLAEDPEAVRTNVFFATAPAIAEHAGFAAVPDGLGCRAVAPAAATNGLDAAVEAYAAARDELGELLSSAADPKDAYSPAVAPFRALAGQSGDRLGCLLARAGETNAALEVFLSADAAFPPGGSAALNAASLLRRGARSPAAAQIGRRLDALARGGERWSLWSEGGPVLAPEDFFETGWFWAVSGLSPFSPDSAARRKAVFDSMSEETRAAAAARLQQAVRPLSAPLATGPLPPENPAAGEIVGAAERLFYRGERLRADRLLRKASFPAPAERAWIVLARARLLATGGEPAKASDILSAALAEAKAEPLEELDVSDRELFLRGLAEVAVESLDLAAARPRLLAIVEEKGLFANWAAKCSAAIGALAAGDAAAANASLAAAVAAAAQAQPPFFPPNWAPLRLRAFFALQTGDLPAAAEAAEALLEARGGHDFLGHYVSALAAQAAGDERKADFHFQASLAERAVWFVLNDYAASLDARGAAAPAVVFARQAVAAGGAEQAAVQDTYGMALLHAGRLDEALAAMRRAAALPGGDAPAIRLDLAEALSENGLYDELAAELAKLEPALAAADEPTRKRAAALRANLAARGE